MKRRIASVLILGVAAVGFYGCSKPKPGITENELRPMTVTVHPWTARRNQPVYETQGRQFRRLDRFDDYLREHAPATSRVVVIVPEGEEAGHRAARELLDDLLPRYNLPAELREQAMELPERPQRSRWRLF